MTYERHLEENIFDLREILGSEQYQHGAYVPFTICDPKQRRIHKATVQDRLVHQAVVTSIEPLFERQFIFDSYSCRKGKGTHAGVTRLRKFLRQTSRNNTQTVYVLKCDVQKFFDSVDHEILMKLLRERIDDQLTLELLQRIIYSHQTVQGRGMPLGNLTSQLFANVYLHELDRFIKFSLKERHYLRYCDDFAIVSPSKEHLESLIVPISDFLRHELKLTIHPRKVTIRIWHQGVDFLGYVLKPHATLLRTKTKHRMIERVTPNNLPSYLGVCTHANGHRLRQLIITKAGASGESA